MNGRPSVLRENVNPDWRQADVDEKALLIGGSSGFKALLGGGRISDDGQYARLEAHGFYWTASESDPVSAWFQSISRLRKSSKFSIVTLAVIVAITGLAAWTALGRPIGQSSHAAY